MGCSIRVTRTCVYLMSSNNDASGTQASSKYPEKEYAAPEDSDIPIVKIPMPNSFNHFVTHAYMCLPSMQIALQMRCIPMPAVVCDMHSSRLTMSRAQNDRPLGRYCKRRPASRSLACTPLCPTN